MADCFERLAQCRMKLIILSSTHKSAGDMPHLLEQRDSRVHVEKRLLHEIRVAIRGRSRCRYGLVELLSA